MAARSIFTDIARTINALALDTTAKAEVIRAIAGVVNATHTTLTGDGFIALAATGKAPARVVDPNAPKRVWAKGEFHARVIVRRAIKASGDLKALAAHDAVCDAQFASAAPVAPAKAPRAKRVAKPISDEAALKLALGLGA